MKMHAIKRHFRLCESLQLSRVTNIEFGGSIDRKALISFDVLKRQFCFASVGTSFLGKKTQWGKRVKVLFNVWCGDSTYWFLTAIFKWFFIWKIHWFFHCTTLVVLWMHHFGGFFMDHFGGFWIDHFGNLLVAPLWWLFDCTILVVLLLLRD